MVEQPVHFDVIILDLTMPIMDGYEACSKILSLYAKYNQRILENSHSLSHLIDSDEKQDHDNNGIAHKD